MSVSIESPRAKPVVARRRNFEKWGWIYMRASGVLLVVLIFGHLFVNVYAGEGVRQIDFAFVAGKLATPFWQWYDFALLTLALVHGANGMRTIVNDYATNPLTNRVLKIALVSSTAVLWLLGTLVLFTFDPCPVSANPDLLPSFCLEL